MLARRVSRSGWPDRAQLGFRVEGCGAAGSREESCKQIYEQQQQETKQMRGVAGNMKRKVAAAGDCTQQKCTIITQQLKQSNKQQCPGSGCASVSKFLV
jgi:hypothetical protein